MGFLQSMATGPARLSSFVDVPQLVAAVNAGKSAIKARVSEDAGLYVCEYTYYTTLLRNPAPAIFVHVPPFDAAYPAEVRRAPFLDLRVARAGD